MNRLKYKEELKKLLYFICSILTVFAVNCNMECAMGAETSLLLNGIYKLYNSISSFNFSDIIILFAVYAMISYVNNYDKHFDKWTCAISVLLSILYVVSMSYLKYDSAIFLLENSFQVILSGLCIIGFSILIYYALRLLTILVYKHQEKVKPENNSNFRHFWAIGFLIILLSWIPWIIMNYPGTSSSDSTSQLMCFLGDSEFTAHHPPLSTYIMGILMVIGESIWNVNFGYFLYILFQTILGALIFSYSMKKAYEFGISLKYCFIGILYYAWMPLWGGTVQEYNKDLLYSEIITLFVVFMVNIIINKKCEKKDCIALFSAGLLASLLRNNGIYAVLPAIIILLFWLKNGNRKRMFLVVCSTMIAYLSIVNILYPCIGIKAGSIREALSIPFLQTARYVDMYEDEVTEYEKEVISSVLDYEALATYNPRHSDSVKNTYKDDNSKLPEYFKVWFQMFCKHPGSYVSAFMNKGAGYMAPVYVNLPSPISLEPEEFLSKLGISHVFGDRFNRFFTLIQFAYMELPLSKYFCMAGTYTWILLICIMLLLREKAYKGLILLIPELMNVLVCIASPTWNIRYALPVMAVLPLMIAWTYYMLLNNKKQP